MSEAAHSLVPLAMAAIGVLSLLVGWQTFTMLRLDRTLKSAVASATQEVRINGLGKEIEEVRIVVEKHDQRSHDRSKEINDLAVIVAGTAANTEANTRDIGRLTENVNGLEKAVRAYAVAVGMRIGKMPNGEDLPFMASDKRG